MCVLLTTVVCREVCTGHSIQDPPGEPGNTESENQPQGGCYWRRTGRPCQREYEHSELPTLKLSPHLPTPWYATLSWILVGEQSEQFNSSCIFMWICAITYIQHYVCADVAQKLWGGNHTFRRPGRLAFLANQKYIIHITTRPELTLRKFVFVGSPCLPIHIAIDNYTVYCAL